MVRWTKQSDREEIRALWQMRFGDSDSFTEWFFRERFSPEHSAVSVEDGRVISSIQSFPLHVKIRDTVIPCCIIAGVSTLPEYEGRGHMGRTMRFLMNGIAERWGTVVPYRPEILTMYQGFGHYPVSRTAYFQAEGTEVVKPSDVRTLDLLLDVSAMQVCYRRFAGRYSGIISRSLADMRLKLADYASDGAAALGLDSPDGLRGYCVYFSGDDSLYAEEFAANDPACEEILLRALAYEAARCGKTVSGKLPPDTALLSRLSLPGFSAALRPMGVMGVGDVRGLLRAVCRERQFRVTVTDAVVESNNGTFDFCGCPTDRTPHVRIAAGRLAQFLCGYRSLASLSEEGLAEVLDHAAVRELDAAFPVQTCYIIDEY